MFILFCIFTPLFKLRIFIMKKIIIAIFLPLVFIVYSCSSTEEVSNDSGGPTMVQMQNYQQQQQNREKEAASRSGLTPDVTQKLSEYAHQKADIACQMAELDKSSSQAFSEAAEAETKQMIITLDNKMTTLNREIEQYCDTEDKTNYLNRLFRQYTKDCQ